MCVFTLALVFDYYPPKKADAVGKSYTTETHHSNISEQRTIHKLQIIAHNAAVIDSLCR